MSQKYRESMDKIFVSDELKAKIMKNAEKKLKKEKPKQKRSAMFFLRYASYAACLALCVTALSTSGRRGVTLPNPSPSPMPAMPAETSEPTGISNNIVVPDKKTPDNQINHVGSNDAAKTTESGNKGAVSNTEKAPEITEKPGNAENEVTIPNEPEVIPPKEDDEFVMAPPPLADGMDISEVTEQVGYKFKLPQHVPEGYSEGEISLLFGNLIQIRYEREDESILYRTEKCSEDISGDYNIYDNAETEIINNCSVTLKGNADKYYVAVWKEAESAFSITSSEGLSREEITKIIENVDFQDNTIAPEN